MTYEQGIYIDNVLFDVPLVSIQRNFDVLDKFAERSEEGDLLREVLGVYANYTLSFGVIEDRDLYDKLIDKLTEPVAFHEFKLPDIKGTFEFRGYISQVSDEVLKIYDDSVTYQNLTCKFTMKKPFRTP